MLAFLGVIVPTLGINVPGYPAEPDWTVALQKAAAANPLGVAQIFLAIGIIEVSSRRRMEREGGTGADVEGLVLVLWRCSGPLLPR